MIRHARVTTRRRFEQGVLQHLDALYGYALMLVRHKQEAEDLVQETCLRAIKRSRQSLPQGELKAWLFTILRNCWINQRKRQLRGPEFLPLDSELEEREAMNPLLVDQEHRPDRLLERRLMAQRIRTAIEALPDVYREVIILRCIEEFSYSEMAQILGCPAGTVMSRLSRARAELRRIVLGPWSLVAGSYLSDSNDEPESGSSGQRTKDKGQRTKEQTQ